MNEIVLRRANFQRPSCEVQPLDCFPKRSGTHDVNSAMILAARSTAAICLNVNLERRATWGRRLNIAPT